MNGAERFINCREQFHAGKEKDKTMKGRGRMGSWGTERGEQVKYMKNFISWNISPCSPLKVIRHFQG
jgi:hypothetical protein